MPAAQGRLEPKKGFHPAMRSRTSGFTLVELLVVIAIIGVLVGLLLPAVQSARESGRRSSCSNNMKQIGLGMHGHLSAKRKFPAGYIYESADHPGSGSSGSNGPPAWGWAVFIMPFIEQGQLFDALGATRPAGQIPLTKLKDMTTANGGKGLLQTNIGTYRCASDNAPGIMKYNSTTLPTASGSASAQGFGWGMWDVGTSNYVASCGYESSDPAAPASCDSDGTVTYIGRPWCARDPDGIFFGMLNSALGISPQKITDGLSKTFALSERCFMQGAGAWAGNGEFNKQNLRGPYKTLYVNASINQDIAGTQPTNYGKYVSSYHPGGVNMMFADGSVAFISENMDSTTMRWSSDRDDGNVYVAP